MPRAKAPANRNGQKPTAIEQPKPITLEELDPNEAILLNKLLSEVSFPDPEAKQIAASLQMKLGRAVQATMEEA